MSTVVNEVLIYGHALAVMAYGGFLLYGWVSGRLQAGKSSANRTLLLALVATALWATVSLVSEYWPTRQLEPVATALDLVRYGLWFAFLQVLLRAPEGGSPTMAVRWIRYGAMTCLGAAAILLLTDLGTLALSAGTDAKLAVALSLPVCGLLLVEQLFRNQQEDSRWNAKPVCIGLGSIFVFDIYLYSEALLFGRYDPDAYAMRGAAHALAVPFLFVASRRGSNWVGRLQVSRSAAFFSATLLLSGAYLLFMSAMGYYVRYFGGTWGRALQLGLLAGGLTLFGVLVFSSSMRSWLRVFVGKHFFSYRYDYREEWLRFTAMLSSKRSPQEMGDLILRGLAKLVECPAGALWARVGNEGDFLQVARWNASIETHAEPPDSSLCTFMRTHSWVIDLDEFRSSPRRYESLVLPTWLLGAPKTWLVVPLLAGDELMGFVLLARPLTPIKLNWEVLDLLKTAGRQAAAYLAQMQATEALLEARKFEAFNRMSAFVVHDLKNIVAQLSLMLKNAERLHDNREFQQDMLLTVQSSLEKMKRLMLQLREGATPPGGSRGVELTPIVDRLQQMAKAQDRVVETNIADRLATRGHDERLERVLGHLLQNALDATPGSGRVWIKVERFSGQVKVEVGDTGIGMSQAFVRDKLFRPFSTTKHSGMGIGTYEGFQYIRELGGSIAVDSEPGHGTVMTVLLPLFEARHGSDLLGPSTR